MPEVIKNTLYITTENLYLNHELEVLKVWSANQMIFSIPLLHLTSIVIFGGCQITPSLMQKCLKRNITISFLSVNGRFLGSLQGSYSGNILLRKRQFDLQNLQNFILKISQAIVAGKLQNQKQVLSRRARESENGQEIALLRESIAKIDNYIRQVAKTENINTLRGIEGEATREYFSKLNYCITQQKEDFYFDKRSRRPPLSRINALLSYTYTVLMNDCFSACQAVGLDPFCGFYHQLRPGRPALALDLMEELRPLADRFVISLINRKQLTATDFSIRTGGMVQISDAAKKILLTAWQDRKKEELTHSYLNQKIKFLQLPTIQAKILARTIRGEEENYIPFLWR